MKTITATLLLLLTSTALFSQEYNSEDVLNGKLENNIYSNDHFGLSMTLPAGWEFHVSENTRTYDGKPILVNALSPGNSCVSIEVSTYYKSHDPGETTNSFAKETFEFQEMSYLDVTSKSDVKPATIGGVPANTYSIEGKYIDDCTRFETQYILLLKGQWLFITTYASTEAEKAILDQAVKSVRFK